jgi:hypothetical protein
MAALAQARTAPILRPVMPHEILAPNEGVVVVAEAPCGTGIELQALDAVANFVRLIQVGDRRTWTIGNLCDAMQAYMVAGVPVRASEIAQAALAVGAGLPPGSGGVRVFQPTPAGEVHQPTMADLVSQLVEAKGLFDRAEGLRAQHKLSFRAQLMYREWAKSTKGLMEVFADVLETLMPAALEALARQAGVTGAEVLRSLRGGSSSLRGLGAPPAALLNPWVIVAALAVLAGIAWVTVPLAIDALKTVGTQAMQSVCLAQILSASERGVDVNAVLRAMPDICQPPDWLTWLYVGGVAAVVGGAGYWWYRRRQRKAA